MKNLITVLIFLLPLFAVAQKTHTVGAKESLFSIGRLYNVHPRELASYNNIPFETGLTIGQVLKIPSKKTMVPVAETASLAPNVAKPEVTKSAPTPVKSAITKGSAAVYHTVAKKEGLYGISKKYNVTIEDIKKWNKLTTDGLTEGMNLIVGYTGTVPDVPSSVTNTPAKKEPPVVKATEPKPVITENVQPVVPTTVIKKEEVSKSATNFSGGTFKSLYNTQVSNKTVSEEKGMAGIFKSTSGWDDGKYYCLHNSASAGTIIKITNNLTQKTVYAKVLDLIPDLKQNSGVVIRVSNAAAAELGAGSTNFECTLNF
ncbi:MAG: LysM peptidoglycan-binding domain-containing protein [Ferruginibacter sp.]